MNICCVGIEYEKADGIHLRLHCRLHVLAKDLSLIERVCYINYIAVVDWWVGSVTKCGTSILKTPNNQRQQQRRETQAEEAEGRRCTRPMPMPTISASPPPILSPTVDSTVSFSVNLSSDVKFRILRDDC